LEVDFEGLLVDEIILENLEEFLDWIKILEVYFEGLVVNALILEDLEETLD